MCWQPSARRSSTSASRRRHNRAAWPVAPSPPARSARGRSRAQFAVSREPPAASCPARAGLTSSPAAISSIPMGTAPDTVSRLVDRFDRDRRVFLSPGYKAEQLRIDSGPRPSIRHSDSVIRTSPHQSLGWDVSNKAGLTEACPERSRRVAGATKAPADGSRPTAHNLRLPDSDSGRSAASRRPIARIIGGRPDPPWPACLTSRVPAIS